MSRKFFGTLLLAAGVVGIPIAGQAQTFRVRKYNIGGESGTDDVTAEPGTGRVFVSRGDTKTISR